MSCRLTSIGPYAVGTRMVDGTGGNAEDSLMGKRPHLPPSRTMGTLQAKRGCCHMSGGDVRLFPLPCTRGEGRVRGFARGPFKSRPFPIRELPLTPALSP